MQPKIAPVCTTLLVLSAAASLQAWQQRSGAEPLANDAIVLRAGEVALTKAEYEKLVPGFNRVTGAVLSGTSNQSVASGQEVARLLALVSEAQRRKLDQDPIIQAELRVRGYVLLANTLLLSLIEDVKKDEAGTRSFYASEKHNYVEVHARHILVRYRGVKAEAAQAKGRDRSPEQAKERAELLYRKLKEGADFASVAQSNSDDETTSAKGGDLNYFTRGQMTAQFETIAYALPIGGLSQPFTTEYGYHIVQVLDHRPLPFDKVRPALENIRARQRFDELGKAGIQLNPTYFQP